MMRYDVMVIELWANISSQSDEANWKDNSYVIPVHFDVDIDIVIVGWVHRTNYSVEFEIRME